MRMHLSRRTAGTLSISLLALGAAGCGGEAARAPQTATVLTVVQGQTVAAPSGTARITDPARAAYVRKVDAICRVRNPERDADVKAAGEASDEHEAVKAYDRSISTADDQLHEIESVTPPRGDADLITTNVIDRLRERIALRKRISRDLADSDATAASRDRAQLDALTIALMSFARGYGFNACGSK